MGFGRFFGKSKSKETSAQPGGSRTSQFFRDEGISVSGEFPIKTLGPPLYAPELSIPNSPNVSTRGGDSDWNPHTPAADLPARRRSKVPWRKSTGPKAPQEQMSGYFPSLDSRPSSIDTGSEGVTPGSFRFSDGSPTSNATSPTTSPFSFGNIRRKPINLRPTASSPNLLASAGSQSIGTPSRRAQHKSTLSSLWESPAPSRPRRGSDVESASTTSPFGAGVSLERSRDLSPFRSRQRESNASTSLHDQQHLADAQEIIDAEQDLELVMAMSASLATANQPKGEQRPSPQQAPTVWRNPSPTPSASSDDLILYRGRDNPRTRRRGKQRASNSQRMLTQEQRDRELAQAIQREEEERATSHASSSRSAPRSYTYEPPAFSYPLSSASPRQLHPNNPFRKTLRNNVPEAAELPATSPRSISQPIELPDNRSVQRPVELPADHSRSVSQPIELPVSPWRNPASTVSPHGLEELGGFAWGKAPSLPKALDVDELLARQLQEEENQGVPKHVSNLQDNTDLLLAMQLADEENQRRREMNSAPKTRDCAVCGDAKLIPELPSLMNCAHEPQVCSECYQGWIESQLNSKSWKEIKCPQDGCKELLKHAEMQQYATPEVYQKFDQLSAREALNDDPNFRWCRGPNCKSGQIHESDISGNLFQCVSCNFKVCTVHEGPWHEGDTCEEYDDRTSGRMAKVQKAQEAASVAAIDQLTKKCPGKEGRCGWKIEKNDGCDHMTCIKCKHQFCWICMADYQPIRDKGNSEHLSSCNYHPSKLPDLAPEQAV